MFMLHEFHSRFKYSDNWSSDGYVYRDDVRIGRHFTSREGVNALWTPDLANIGHIEALRWKLRNNYLAFFRRMMDHAFALDPACRGDFIIKLFDHRNKHDCFLRFDEENNVRGYSMNWEIPARWAKLPVVEYQGFYEFYEYERTLRKRLGKINTYMELALENEQFKLLETPKLGTYCFTVNGRHYWYHLNFSRLGNYQFDRIYWPESETHFLTLT